MIESLIVLVVLIFIFYFAYQYDKKHKDENIGKNHKNSQTIKNNNELQCKLPNIYGLGLPTNTICEIISHSDYYEFIASNNSFKLDKNKVTDVSIKSDIDIQNQYVSSIGGAVAGAALFGPLGAIVGGRTKKKQIKKISLYLIFTYTKDDNIQYISFNTCGKLYCNKFVDEFKKLHKKSIATIEL